MGSYRFLEVFTFHFFFMVDLIWEWYPLCMCWCSDFRRTAQREGRESLDVSLEGEELEGTEEEREKVCRERYAKLKDKSLHFSASSASKGR